MTDQWWWQYGPNREAFVQTLTNPGGPTNPAGVTGAQRAGELLSDFTKMGQTMPWAPMATSVCVVTSMVMLEALAAAPDPRVVAADVSDIEDRARELVDTIDGRPPVSVDEIGYAVTANHGPAIGRAVLDGWRVANPGGGLDPASLVVAVTGQAPGHRVDRGFALRFYTARGSHDDLFLDRPQVLVIDEPATSVQQVVQLTAGMAPGRPIVAIAHEVANSVISALHKRNPPVEIAAPSQLFLDKRTDLSADTRALCPGGAAIAVSLEKTRVTIVAAGGDSAMAHVARVSAERAAAEAAYQDNLRTGQKVAALRNNRRREELAERLAALARGAAIISVGAPLPIDGVRMGLFMAEMLFFQKGLLPGGASTFMTVQRQLESEGRLASPGGMAVARGLEQAARATVALDPLPRAVAWNVVVFGISLALRFVAREALA